MASSALWSCVLIFTGELVIVSIAKHYGAHNVPLASAAKCWTSASLSVQV